MVELLAFIRRPTALDLFLINAQGFAEALVEFQRDDRLGELVQIPTEDVRSVVYCIARPIQTFSISLGGIEDLL